MIVRKFLFAIDIFGFHPSLLIDKKQHLSTIPGSLCTILVACLFFFFLFSSDFFQKTNPKVFSQPFTYQHTPALKFSKETFPLFLTLVDSFGKTYNDSKIFQFQIEQIKLEKNYSLDYPTFQIKEKLLIEMKKCQREDLIPFSIFTNEEVDVFMSTLHYNCLNEEELTVQGDLDENQIIQVIITVSPCNNQTSNITCKSLDEIENFFKEQKKIILGYIGFNEDVEKFENPLINNFKYESYDITYNQQLQEMISLKKTFFKTISGISDERNIVSIKPDEKKTEFFNINSYPDALVFIALQASKKYEKITRTYQNIGEALATSFSLIKVIMILIKILMWYLNKITIKLHLVNKIYDFDIGDERKSFYESDKINKEKENLKEKNNKNLKGLNSLKLSVFQAFIADFKNFFFKERTTLKEKIYLETENIIQRDTNLIYIIQKLHEIDKIKLILFNDKQLFLFNFFTKPIIYLPQFNKRITPNKKLADSLAFNEHSNLKFDVFERNLSEIIKILSNSDKIFDKHLLMYLDQRFNYLKDDDDMENLEKLIPIFRRYTIS